MPPTLKPLQVEHVQRIRAACAARKRIIVVQGATGYGKNTVAAYLVSQAYEKNVPTLFMVHRRKLVEQISERLGQFDVPHGILMRGESRTYNSIQVASRDTLLSRCVRNEWVGMPEARLVLVDEAHHAADPDSEYRRVLQAYPEAVILLLTATPVAPDGSGLGPWAQALVCAVPTSQLVREGYLVPVKVYAPDRKKRGRKYVKGIAGDLVESWKQYAENRATVLFCSRVAHSLDAVEAYRAAGIPAAHMDADTSDEDRDQIFADIASGKIKVLSNVGIIGEGVDVPELGCCQLFCEVGSRVRFLQACGRIMRVMAGKEYGILIDHSGAVFKHGFPDEDTVWTLEGNVDEDFKRKHDAGETEKAFYCKWCELAYHGQNECPQCGRAPSKPPKSIFAPPPMSPSNELLTEAERNEQSIVYSKEQKITFWWLCLRTAIKRNGTFKMASRIFNNKYSEWPGNDFPCNPDWSDRGRKVLEVYPNLKKDKVQV